MSQPLYASCRSLRSDGGSIVISVPKKALRQLDICPEEIESHSETVRVSVSEDAEMVVDLSPAQSESASD